MPFWTIYAPEGAYTNEQKQAFTESITQIYVDFAALPRFYVVVAFHEYTTGGLWVGAKPVDNVVRVWIDHIARRMPDDDGFREMAMQAFEDAIEPHVKDRGFNWEIHIDETPLQLWRVNGITPPPAESAAEKQWDLDNRPSPWVAELAALA
jgi:phenylpyruvate tautomerase PptA (4-oxalocrotonate tautomerase family)